MTDPRVTLREVAERAGVHPSTVSRALSDSGAGQLENSTVQRVRAIAASLGYEPNPWARSLRTRRSRTLGLVLPRLSDTVMARIFEAAEDRARESGYQAVTVSSRDEASVQQMLVQRLLDQRVDGLVLGTPRINDPVLERLAADGVPFVLVNRASGQHPGVAADDEVGGLLASRHLLAQGHERIGLIAGPLDVSTAAGRRDGYVRAHEEAGRTLDESLIVQTPDFTAESGAAAAGCLLGSRRGAPTALFCVNDATAIGAMAAARDLSLRIPEDLAVVGYNDTPLAHLLPVPLSSVSIPLGTMGREAVELLLRLLAGEPVEPIRHAPQLRVRASSDRRLR